MKYEVREVPIDRIEIREEDDSEKIVMYPAIFNSWSQDLGGFKERIKPGAFKESIENDDIIAAFNHNNNMILGRNTSGTLELKEDNKGLRAVIDPPDSYLGEYVTELIDRGDIEGGSFKFEVYEEDWEFNSDELDERELIEVGLRDVGPVTRPAYLETEVNVRTAKEVHKENSPGGSQSGRADGRLGKREKELELYENIIKE